MGREDTCWYDSIKLLSVITSEGRTAVGCVVGMLAGRSSSFCNSVEPKAERRIKPLSDIKYLYGNSLSRKIKRF